MFMLSLQIIHIKTVFQPIVKCILVQHLYHEITGWLITYTPSIMFKYIDSLVSQRKTNVMKKNDTKLIPFFRKDDITSGQQRTHKKYFRSYLSGQKGNYYPSMYTTFQRTTGILFISIILIIKKLQLAFLWSGTYKP